MFPSKPTNHSHRALKHICDHSMHAHFVSSKTKMGMAEIMKTFHLPDLLCSASTYTCTMFPDIQRNCKETAFKNVKALQDSFKNSLQTFKTSWNFESIRMMVISRADSEPSALQNVHFTGSLHKKWNPFLYKVVLFTLCYASFACVIRGEV
jgi:hypothetical protein